MFFYIAFTNELDTYSKMTGTTHADHVAKPLAFYGHDEVMEGVAVEGL